MIEEEYKIGMMKMDNAREQELVDLPVFIDKMRKFSENNPLHSFDVQDLMSRTRNLLSLAEVAPLSEAQLNEFNDIVVEYDRILQGASLGNKLK